MGQIAKALKALIENSDDLSTLPQLVAQVESLEESELGYQERISKLQDINKAYLAQIPIPGQKEDKEDEVEEPTLADAKNYLIETLGGDK
jgi:hypothetical protein